MMGGMAQLAEEEEESSSRGFTSGTDRVGVSGSRSSSLRQSMFSKLEDSTGEGMRAYSNTTRTHTTTHHYTTHTDTHTNTSANVRAIDCIN